MLLRLALGTHLLPELIASVGVGRPLKTLTVHRVPDNVPLVLDAEDLWIALNFQLIHDFDMIPITCHGQKERNNMWLQSALYKWHLLRGVGRVLANVSDVLANYFHSCDDGKGIWAESAQKKPYHPASGMRFLSSQVHHWINFSFGH